MPILILIYMLLNPFIWNTHTYPKRAERLFITLCENHGGTKKQCTCDLQAGENAWTVREAVDQGMYYLQNKKLTDEAWKIHVNCIPKK